MPMPPKLLHIRQARYYGRSELDITGPFLMGRLVSAEAAKPAGIYYIYIYMCVCTCIAKRPQRARCEVCCTSTARPVAAVAYMCI